jgi:FAD/FMN-containing dehydrogenase
MTIGTTKPDGRTAAPSATTPPPTEAAASLRRAFPATVQVPGDPAYDTVRMPWNVAVEQLPAAVAVPRDADEVAQVVRAAVSLGLRIAPQGTGHGASTLVQHGLDDVVLLRTSELTELTIDAGTRTARVGAGVLWQDVVEAAAPHGLAALHGSSPDVGVAGYTLGGGIGWYCRSLGLASESVTAVELVTADGSLVRTTGTEEPDLFWALRGGGGGFGVVTALEFRLHPIADAYAGMLLWDIQHAEPVLRRWAQWCADAPEEATTSYRVLRFPPLPELPDVLRGRDVVVVDGAVLGDDELGAAQVAGLRELEPEVDTFARVPAASLGRLHMDPEGPTPSVGGSTLLRTLDDATITDFIRVAGPDAESTLLVSELRQLGGALSRRGPESGALGAVDGDVLAFFVGIAPTPQVAAAGEADTDRALEALAPHAARGTFLNLAERPVDPSASFEPDAWARLRAVRSRVDPGGVFVANHDVPPADRAAG